MMKTNQYIIVSIVCVLFSLLCFSINKMDPKIPNIKRNLVVKTIRVDNSFGYEIFEKGHIIIKQDYIPVLSGKQNFCTEKDAHTVGKMIKNKIANNESPTISFKELVESKISLHCPQNTQNDILP